MASERRQVAILFPADSKEQLSKNVEQSRFADTAKALCAAGSRWWVLRTPMSLSKRSAVSS
jgi:hypothetical protein